MRDVLVRAASLGDWDEAVGAAARFAARFHGGLTALYAVPGGVPAVAATADGAAAVAAAYRAELAREVERAQAYDTAFAAWASSLGVRHPAWVAHAAGEADALAYASNWHDLLVLPLDDRSEDPWCAASAVAQIVLRAPVPCLALPRGAAMPARCEVVAIAFNGAVESIRALHAALPLLEGAARIVVLQGEGKPVFEPPPPFPLRDWCTRHLPHVEYQAMGADADADALLQAAHAAGAQLLVMGAYGHSRFAEWVLGGVTHHMLRHADLPLLLRH